MAAIQEAPIVHAARMLGERAGPRVGTIAAKLTQYVLPEMISAPDDPRRNLIDLVGSGFLEGFSTLMPALLAFHQTESVVAGAAVGLAAYAIDRALMMFAHASNNHSDGQIS